MRKLMLDKGRFALVDDEDFVYLNQFVWCVSHGYPSRGVYNPTDQKTQVISLHKLLINPPNGKQVDHIDGDKLNNQKSNLRICSNAENSRNKEVTKSNTSGYKGVDFYPKSVKKPWRAKITHNYKTIGIGYFITKEEAARAYDTKAKELFGEFANLNFKD